MDAARASCCSSGWRRRRRRGSWRCGRCNLIANLLGALREGDYSIRGLSARSGSSMAMVMREVNDLGSTLQRQRTEAMESTALLTHVMEEIGVAVFAFDPTNQLLLVNRAGERLIGKTQRRAGRARRPRRWGSTST